MCIMVYMLQRHSNRMPCADCASKVFEYGIIDGRPLCPTCYRYATGVPVCAGCCNEIVQRNKTWVHASGKPGRHPITPLVRTKRADIWQG